MAGRYPGVREIKRGEVYEIGYSVNGKRRQHRIKAISKRDAAAIRARYTEDSTNLRTAVASIPLAKEKLRRKCVADGNSPKTVINLMAKLHTFTDEFLAKYHPEVTDLNKITAPMMEEYKEFIVIEKRRADGWRDEITKIKSIFGKLIAVGLCRKEIKEGVLDKIKKPKRKEKLYKEVSPQEMRELLAYVKKDRPDYHGALYLIMRLGWRREQVLSLKRRNVRFEELRPVAIACEPEDTKTKQPFVLEYLDDEIVKVVRTAYLRNRSLEWLFPSRTGRKIHSNHYTTYIAKVSADVIGKRLTPHDFRHNFCTQRKREGMADRDIMAITGHKDIGSFQIYTHPTGIGVRKVLENGRIY